jgi:hypothetical protein
MGPEKHWDLKGHR